MAHEHHNHHRHDHQHQGHQHGEVRHDRAFAIGSALNIGFVVVEVIFGIAANSMALLSDAVHNLGDVMGLLLGWGAAWLTRQPPTRRRTYGWGRSSILAALLNATILLIGVGAIGIEAVQRLLNPQPVLEFTVILVAAAGIVVNGVSALLFMRGGSDLNVRSQFLHLAGDAGVSAAVVVAGLLILLTGWQWLDPVASLAVGVLIVVTTWGLLRESVDLAMDAVPGHVTEADVQDYLTSVPGVLEVHDLHIWGLSTTQTALTAHLVFADDDSGRSLHDVTTTLRDRFGIGHSTLQVESNADAELCRLRPHDVV